MTRTEPGAAGTVLVVEDDAPTRAVLVAALTGEGYRVDTAADGQAALLRLQTDSAPHMILVDVWMPVMDGQTFLRTYHAGPGPHVPVVVTTAGKMSAAEATEAGAAGLLLKPFSLDALLDLVAQQIGRN